MPTTYELQQLLASDLQVAELKRLSHICYSFVKLHSLFEMVNQPKIAYYRDLFIAFKVKEERMSASGLQGDIDRRVANYIDREIERYQKKVIIRSSIMTMKDEKE
jgi:hypothetical protein